MISTETQRMKTRYEANLNNPNWTVEDLRILETAIADRLQIELPANQAPLFPNPNKDKESDDNG